MMVPSQIHNISIIDINKIAVKLVPENLSNNLTNTAFSILQGVYSNEPTFFMGKRKKTILSSIIYLAQFNIEGFPRRITQGTICSHLELSEPTLRKTCHKIVEILELPEIFERAKRHNPIKSLHLPPTDFFKHDTLWKLNLPPKNFFNFEYGESRLNVYGSKVLETAVAIAVLLVMASIPFMNTKEAR